jgi:hypothetical protein
MASLVIFGFLGPSELIVILIGIVLVIALIFLLRGFGAWLFRIDEVIKLQKQILEELKKKNAGKES